MMMYCFLHFANVDVEELNQLDFGYSILQY